MNEGGPRDNAGGAQFPERERSADSSTGVPDVQRTLGHWDDQEDWGKTERSYGDAEAAADLATYRALKKSVSFRTLLVVAIIGAATAFWFPIPALALVAGGVCGIFNSLLLMRSNERVVETRSVGGFVFSSFLRIAVFGIVPVAFAVKGPWWSMAAYFAGFFLPLALYMASVQRAFKRE